MAIEIINVGASPNDGNGDPIRDAFIKCNDNFDELDTTKIGGSGTDNFVAKFNGTDSIENSLIFDDGSFVGVNTTTPSTYLEVSGPDYSFSAGRQASNRKVSIGLNDNGQPSIQSFDSSNAPVNLTINPSGGNVGVGTLNPLGLLHLYKSGVTTRMVIDGDAGQSKIITYRTGGLQRFGMYLNNTAESGSNAGSDFQIRSYNDAGSLLSTPFFIKRSTGNVGIGTTSPSGKLDVFSTSDVYQNIITSGSGTSSVLSMYNSSGNTDGAAIGYNGAIRFGTITGVNAGGFSEKMRIASNGNVGIGTTSPSNKLDVNGNINVPSTNFFRYDGDTGLIGSATTIVGGSSNQLGIRASNDILFATNGANERMRIASSGQVQISSPISDALKLTNSNSSAYNGVLIQNDASNQVVLGMGGSSVGGTNQNRGYSGTISNIDYYLMTNNTARLLINSSGNVGIGTTNILSKLNVANSYYAGVATKANSAAFFENQGVGVYIGGSEYSYGYIQAEQVDNTSLKNLVLQPNGGSVNIANLGTGLVYSNGGTLTSTNPSDERLKNNITDLQYGLIEILQLRPVSYNWKNDRINQGKQFGFIAQEVQQIMPDLISEFTTTENNEEVIRLGLDKEAIFVAMVNAIKELKSEIEILKNK